MPLIDEKYDSDLRIKQFIDRFCSDCGPERQDAMREALQDMINDLTAFAASVEAETIGEYFT